MVLSRDMNSLVLIFVCLFFFVGCGANQPVKTHEVPVTKLDVDYSNLEVSFDQNTPLQFFGKKDNQAINSGNSGSMAYPAYNGVSFLAAIVTHAVIQDGSNSKQKREAQELADQVLHPYEPYTSILRLTDILPNNLTLGEQDVSISIINAKDQPSLYLHAHSTPVIYLDQTERTWIVKNGIDFSSPLDDINIKDKERKPEDMANFVVVEVHSFPALSDSPRDYWVNDGFHQLASELKTAYQLSLRLGLEQYYAHLNLSDSSQVKLKKRVIRYQEGGKKRVEQGVVLNETCQRYIFKSLAGVIKAVPKLHFENCA